jgi:HEAT repeat protein
LAAALNDERNRNLPELGAAAAQALGRFADRRAVPALIKALEASSAVAFAAADALGDIGDVSAVDALRLAQSYKDARVHLAASWALIKLGDVSGFRGLLGCTRSPLTAARAVTLLGFALKDRSHRIDVDDLRLAAELHSVVQQELRDPDDMFSGLKDVTVDCGEVRALAEKELSRRGLRI